MRFLSLFAGIGGFDLGFERAGMVCAGQVELARFSRRVLERRWPQVKRMEDIRDVKGNEFGSVDVVCGGFPCQDLSVAGRRAGLAGERSGLFFEACRIIEAARAQWFALENVPGLFSSDGGRDHLVVLRTLEGLGYGLAWRVLDSQYFGLAQQRRRVFLVGRLGGPCPPEVLFEPESLSRDTAPRREKGARVAALTGNGVGTCGADDNQAQAGHIVAAPLVGKASYGDHISRETHLICMAHGQGNAEAVRDGSPSLTCNHEAPVVAISGEITHALRAEGFDGSEDGTGRGTPVVMCYENHGQDSRVKEMGDIAPAIHAKAGTGGGNLPLLYHRNASCMVTAQDGHAAALRSEGEHSYQFIQSGFVVRRLTPRECERLQGFPDDWTKLAEKTADGPRYKALGNAVSVPVAEWIGRRLMSAPQ